MTDDFKDIVVPDPVTIADLVALKEKYAGRFDFELHGSGKMADIRYKNYKTTFNDAEVITPKRDAKGNIIKGEYETETKTNKGGRKLKAEIVKTVVVE